ncbi:MAG TPA: 6-phosphogluconolactonase [Verrucomicrobiae bacterium]|nr:6-phosphogluconolactonase [Verrucomicrobiae bacterium]
MKNLNIELLAFSSADTLASAAAGAWLDEIESAGRAGKRLCVALSGGRITKNFFAFTVEQTRERGISFAHVHFFWADERCVPPTDPESNFKLASDLLFTPLKVAAGQVHRIHGEEAPETAVKIAEAELRRFAALKSNNSEPVLDLILLGMGEDGHVASLFPEAPPEILQCTAPFLLVKNSPKPPPERVSLSHAAIAAATRVWVLISGAGKEAALRESLRPGGQTPLAQVIRSRSQTKIFSDVRLD